MLGVHLDIRAEMSKVSFMMTSYTWFNQLLEPALSWLLSVLISTSVFFFFIFQLQHEKAELEQHLEQEQEFQVNKLMKKIKKLENDTISKQLTLEQVKMYGSLSVSLIRIVLFFFFSLISTVLSNFKRSCGISVKNIFHLCLHTVGTSI